MKRRSTFWTRFSRITRCAIQAIFPGAESSRCWKLGLLVVGLTSLSLSSVGHGAVFTVQPITFYEASPYDRIVATGTITTAGNTSAISDWSVKVTTHSRLAHYSQSNTANYSIDVTSDGRSLTVPTSPDGVLDGGSLFFRSPNPFMDFGVAVADFSHNFGFDGGQAFLLAGGGIDLLPLNQPSGINYVGARANPSAANTFDLVPLDFGSGVTLSGTIQTDGTTGLLSPANILAWDIFADAVSEDVFDSTNSVVLQNLVGLSADGRSLTVDNPDGYLTLSKGISGGHLYAAQLADFSSQSPLGGQAGYLQGRVSVLTVPLNAADGPWTVGAVVPEPSSGVVCAIVMCSLALHRIVRGGSGPRRVRRP